MLLSKRKRILTNAFSGTKFQAQVVCQHSYCITFQPYISNNNKLLLFYFIFEYNLLRQDALSMYNIITKFPIVVTFTTVDLQTTFHT
jgi:hypothetical protein